jgi:hypothetical protein
MDVLSNKWVRDVGPLLINSPRMFRYLLIFQNYIIGISIIFFFKLKHLTHLDIVSVIERLLPKQTGSEIDQLIKLLILIVKEFYHQSSLIN